MPYHDDGTIVSVAQERADEKPEHPEHPCVTLLSEGGGQEAHLTYKQLDDFATAIAGWLTGKGLERGHRALVALPYSIEFTQIFYGRLYGGILAVPSSEPAGTKQVKSYLAALVSTLKTSKPKLLITTPTLLEFLYAQLPLEPRNLIVSVPLVSSHEIIKDVSPSPGLPALAPADIAHLQLPSDGTGMAKGIMGAYRSIMTSIVIGGGPEEKDDGAGSHAGVLLMLLSFVLDYLRNDVQPRWSHLVERRIVGQMHRGSGRRRLSQPGALLAHHGGFAARPARVRG